MPFLIAGAGTLYVIVRRRAWRRALLTLGARGRRGSVVLAPWTIFASSKAGKFVPVSKGSAAALFVGTYLPGGGTTIGMKMHLEKELRARHPEKTAGVKTYKIPAGVRARDLRRASIRSSRATTRCRSRRATTSSTTPPPSRSRSPRWA